MKGENHIDNFYHNDALRYYFQGAMCQIRRELDAEILAKDYFMYVDIDYNQTTFTYYLN